jgi:hypothetical protein
LTFVNQVGAAEGMNQAAPGSFIPESFVRWSQDVLYDRVGYLRRRAPYTTLALYNEIGSALAQPDTAGQRVIGVVNTRNPANENVLGIIVTDGTTTRVLFYNSEYRKTCFCPIEGVRQDTIVFSRPTLNGGVFIGLLENYGVANAQNKNLLYYWRGGTGEGDYTVNSCTLGITNNSALTGAAKASSDKIERTAHGLPNGYPIEFTNVGTITGISTGTVYYVVSSATNDFQVASTVGGSPINLGGTDSTVSFIQGGHVTYTNRITGTFDTSKLSAGMFVYRVAGAGDERYLGVLNTWATDGSYIDLEKDCIRTYGYGALADNNTAADIKFVNIRPYVHNHGRGLITKTAHGLTVTSGTIGSEGEGHFAAADLSGTVSGTRWALYRASDGEWLGDVASVESNSALTLNNVYHTDIVPMNADEYVARPYKAITQANDATFYTGVFNTTYAGYQWFGNGGEAGTENRIVFSAYHDPESVDLSRDSADSIIIPGTQQMRGIATSSSGLVIFLEDKTYLLRGNYRSNFSLEELYPEGCLSAQSIVEYGGGVFWASKNGVLFFDGATVRNLTESNLGSYYTDSIKTFDANERRIYSFFYKDYLFMTFTGFASNYTPLRYEPVYAGEINDTPAIAGFQADDWDPDFTPDDFLVENNVPIYWNSYNMYSSSGVNQQTNSGFWSAGVSLVGVTTTSGSDAVTGVSLASVTGNADVSTDTITLTSHGLEDDTIIRFTSIGTVTGLTVDTTDYYVINSTSNTFEVSTSVGGSAVDLTGTTDDVDFVDITPISVGYYVVGPGIPVGTVIGSVVDPTEIELEDGSGNPVNATATGTVTLQALPAAPTGNTWSKSLQFVWGPVNFIESMTFAIYVPTNAITAISNFDFRGFIKLDSAGGTKGYAGINAVNADNLTGTYARLIDVDSMLNPINNHTTTTDSELSENLGKQPALYQKGPDFYLQTKHYTVGDPVMKKWFRQIMLNLYLLDGGIRMDVVDMEDNDRIDVQKKRHINWELFEEYTFPWNDFEGFILPKLLSPNRSTWQNLEQVNKSWYEVTDSEFTRRKKKISWRYPSTGFRLYQMNDYRPANYQVEKRPHTVVIDSWNIGFKPMRASRV